MTIGSYDQIQEGHLNAINCKVYPISQPEDDALKEFLMEQLEKGYIHPSKSQYTLSFFFITKKDRKLCLVQNHHQINDYNIHNQYLLPLITDLITDL